MNITGKNQSGKLFSLNHQKFNLVKNSSTSFYIYFYLFRAPEQSEGENAEKVEEVAPIDAEFTLEAGAWEENFKSAHDSKPNGPEAVALDFSFPEAVSAYGLPEHADSFALKSTK